MFPDDTSGPLYNTADASLWYFVAIYRYIKYLKDDPKVGDNYMKEVLTFIRKDIFPALLEIIENYKNGTDFSIGMESNGLIHAGSDLDQVTWMDVKNGDTVMTPRHGCPVEINALWYNALCIMEYLCKIYGYDGTHYASLAGEVKSSFGKAFWNDSKNCLYDVVVYDAQTDSYTFKDASIRPNQILAISLPFSVLSVTQERSVVAMAEKKLYVGVGLRSLSTDSPEYHGVYKGSLKKRDEAYHQGTAWSYLLGAYFTAYRKVNGPGRDCTEKLLEMLKPVLEHMEFEAAIGGISEVFDGDKPHLPGGCYNQAWSVGEILRAYTEDIMPYRQNI
jgi:predicted glycogen debranching enzyme